MDIKPAIVQIVDFFKKIYSTIQTNKTIAICIFIIVLIVAITYIYTYSFRVKRKMAFVLNNLKYTKPRLQIDFCGSSNRTNDTLYFKKIIIDKEKHTITFDDDNINLYDLGLSSEYMIKIENSDKSDKSDKSNNGIYKIQKVSDSKILIIVKPAQLTAPAEAPTPPTQPTPPTSPRYDITYFKPNSNINTYKYKKLTDYYIASSHRSFLIGTQKADYCSVDMINRVLFFGARYIELEIFNKDVKHDTVPIVTSGYEVGSMKLQLNYLYLQDCLEMISKMAFSDTHINNFNDPLFLFLNLKVGDNIGTLNQIATLIKKYFSGHLLSRKYLDTNLANTTLCELKRKVVIMCGYGWRNSELKEVVNMSIDSPYLKRLTIHEVLNYSERATAKFTIKSNNVHFKSGATNSIIEILEPSMDLPLKGMKPSDTIVVKGAEKSNNNSGNFLFKVINISKNKIVLDLDKKNRLVNEAPNNMITIDVYDKSFTGTHQSLDEYNKSNFTICVPDDRYYSSNYNYKDAMYKGCQFVAMNYQSGDELMKDYFDMFMEKTFIFKPTSLIHYEKLPTVEGISFLNPHQKVSIDYDIDYEFLNLVNKKVKISTLALENIGVVHDTTKKSFKLDLINPYDNSSTDDTDVFILKNGLNNSGESFSLQTNTGINYLTFSENCCHLSIKSEAESKPSEDDGQFNWKSSASFIPLKPKYKGSKPDGQYNSFGVKIRKDINGTGDSQEIMYYLKHRPMFNPKKRLFLKTTESYKLKAMLLKKKPPLDNTDIFVIYKVDSSQFPNYLPLGDIVLPLPLSDSLTEIQKADLTKISPTKPPFETTIVSGDVAHPIGYKKVYESTSTVLNKSLHYNNQKFTIWKPIAPSGYTALGMIFKNGTTKPLKGEIYCIANYYIKEAPFKLITTSAGVPVKPEKSDFYNQKSYSDNKTLNLWTKSINKEELKDVTNPNNGIVNYFTANELFYPSGTTGTDIENLKKEPSVMSQPHYIINPQPDLKDRIYLDYFIDNTDEDQKSAVFGVKIIDDKVIDSGGQRFDKLLDIDDVGSKLVSFTKARGGDNMCMGLPMSYTSSYYNFKKENDDKQYSKLNAIACGQPTNFGTNFKIYNDNTIRLADNNNICVTHNLDYEGLPVDDKDSPENYLYLDKCTDDSANTKKNQKQKFLIEDRKLKVFSDGEKDTNACITHAPDNTLRLETCGDQKYTALYLWDDNIFRDDYCFMEQAEKQLNEVGAIERCVDNAFYVIYLDGVIKHKEFCQKQSALTYYNEITPKYPGGVIIAHRGKVINQTMSDASPPPLPPANFLNKMNTLSMIKGECYSCKKASKMLCSKQRMEDTPHNSFDTFEEEKRLMKYCMTMRDVDEFRCSRGNRQKFTNFPVPEDYCLSEGKTVYIKISDVDNTGIDVDNTGITDLVKRHENSSNTVSKQFPVQNLLGENYLEHYEVFARARILNINQTDVNLYDKQYKIVFDNVLLNNVLTGNPLKLDKMDDNIVIDYKPKEYMINVGSKVLVNPKNYYFNTDNISATVEVSNCLKPTEIKFMGVVIKKISSTMFSVMMSINSYESNMKNKEKLVLENKGTYPREQISTQNPVVNVSINQLVLYKKASTCHKPINEED